MARRRRRRGARQGTRPLACKTDKIDARVLAELCRRDLVPAIWLPSPQNRGERERSRWRVHMVRHRVSLKNRIHATLLRVGHRCPTSDLFGVEARRRLAEMNLPEPWLGTVKAGLRLIDQLEAEIDSCERELRGLGAQHAYIPNLMTVPGIGWGHHWEAARASLRDWRGTASVAPATASWTPTASKKKDAPPRDSLGRP